MKRHFENELDFLKEGVLKLATEVEEAVRVAVAAVAENDPSRAREIIEHDEVIDQHEIRIEEECLKILALHQPMAGDLRYVVALLKMNNELERIGDLAVNIADRAISLSKELRIPEETIDFAPMMNQVRTMLRDALDSLVSQNSLLAAEVIRKDDTVDQMHSETFHKISELIPKYPQYSSYYLNMLSVSRNLERIADCATNIGEDVIYLEQGRIVRHCKNLE